VTSKTRYARSGDVSIAYQVVGDGPIDLVWVPGIYSHLEFWWTEPVLAQFTERLAEFSRLILFDKRGTGMSDRDVGIATLEERMDDVRAVMDAAGSERAAIYGASEGGPMAALFAATYPERTTALVLFGTFPRATAAPGWPGMSAEDWKRSVDDAFANFPDSLDIETYAPSVSGDPAIREWWSTLTRMSASPGSLRSLLTMVGELDVRSVLPTIQVPTMVLHRQGDLVVPIAAGEYIASKIPGAEFVALEGVDHVPFGDIGPWTGAIEEFLTGTRHEKVTDRVLATVVFTDIVASTDIAVRLGDAEWKRLLDRHDLMARRTAKRFSGRVVKTTGDGVLATFDGPARAARFASDFAGEAKGIGLPIRAGLHTGEVELRDDDIGGIAVHIAARIAGLAGAGDVLASRTVKDLTTGSGLLFTDRGARSLKGVPDEWQVYAVAY
jgi:pimeloyl-ACP methyl ester carboxylesterase/class 3 adenylate cyclase